MYIHKTYMYINFQQNRVCRSVKNVHTNVFTKKIASFINLQLPIEFFLNRLFQTCVIVKRTCMSIFSKIWLMDQSKPCTQICLQKIANCNSNFEPSCLSDMHYPITDIQANFEINRLIRYQVTVKKRHWHIRTDGRTARHTDVAYDNNR